MKPPNTLLDLQFRLRLGLLVVLGVAGPVVFALMAFVTIGEVRTGANVNKQNHIAFNLARDFLNPSQSLMQTEVFFHRIRMARNPADIEQARQMLLAFRAGLETNHRYYQQAIPPGHLRDLAVDEAYASAEEWYNIAEREYLPEVERGGWQSAERIRTEKMDALVQRNLHTCQQVGELAEAWVASNQQQGATSGRSRIWQLVGVGLVILFFQILLGGMINSLVGRSTGRLQGTLDVLRRKNAEVETFVYIVSNDLRAPLVNLQGFVRELEESCGQLRMLAAERTQVLATSPAVRCQEMAKILDGDVATALRFISASATKFDRLINALLNLSRQGRQTYKWTLVDVNELVAQTIASMQQQFTESGASIRVDSLPQGFMDENSLSQVFSNLISNAIKYRSPDRPLHIEIGGAVEGESVHFWVRDNGLGLPESSKDRVFHAFQRFHPQRADGDGMGLALVQRIAERHGGRVWVESLEEIGSTFHFSVPASPVTTPC